MRADEIIEYVRKHIEPLPAVPPSGCRYRVAGTLNDGTILPCIVVEDSALRVDLAIRRFDESRNVREPSMGYRAIVTAFAASGNRVNDYDLATLSPSPHAIGLERMGEIKGETSMSWTEFYATMTDGIEFAFGTTFRTEFFDMPDGYSSADIAKIRPAVRGVPRTPGRLYRDRPFFTCFVPSP